MESLEIDLYYRCLNRCRFCANDDAMRAFADHPLSYSEVLGVLRRRRGEGFSHVNFTGGEPTLHPRFAEVLEAAKGLGYRTQVTTSGPLFSLDAFTDRVLPHLDLILFSVHGARAETHDALTGRPGSFARLGAGLRSVARSRPRPLVWTNTVVTSLNIAELPEIMAFLAGFPMVRECWFTALLPGGEGARRYAELAAPYSSLLAQVGELRRIGERAGAALKLYNLPFCASPDLGLVGELSRGPSVAVARRLEDGGRIERVQESPCPQPVSEKAHTPRCAGCAFRSACGGLWRPYLERFGDAGLRALGADGEPLA